MDKILVLANKDITIYLVRKELIEKLIDLGYKVIISCPYGDKLNYFKNIGCDVVITEFNRKGTNPLSDLLLIHNYKKLIKKIEPLCVLSFTIKPNIYGGIACRRLKVPFIPNVTGLGRTSQKNGLFLKILKFLYKQSFNHAFAIFFQNTSNMQFFSQFINNTSKFELIPGSGVNLQINKYEDLIDDGICQFLFMARIMKEKGIEEFLYSAQKLKIKYLDKVDFIIAGFCEESYTTKLNMLNDEGIIKYLGFVDNPHELIKKCDCVVLPSYHEGMSNVLLEAQASGRAVIASNVPGCIETFENGESGFSVRARDKEDLLDKMEKFLQLDFDTKRTMGLNGRKKVELEFDRNIVIDKYICKIREI